MRLCVIVVSLNCCFNLVGDYKMVRLDVAMLRMNLISHFLKKTRLKYLLVFTNHHAFYIAPPLSSKSLSAFREAILSFLMLIF